MSEIASRGPNASAGARDSAQALLSMARSRVSKRLERAVDFPLLILSAPTGFGKSTVLREFFKATGRPYRCLDVAPNQGDLLGFMRAFANSLGDLVPALLTSFLGVYDRMHSTEEGPKKIADWAAGHLMAIDVTFVIDGLQNVMDDRLFSLLIELVDQTVRANIRWVLVSEAADRFPIARWLANDRLDLPLDDIDFALTLDDLSLAVERSHTAISQASILALCRMTDNWPATIALALCDIPGLPALVSDGQSRPYAYFAERALAARPEAEQRFLLETCLYKHFDVELLDAAGWVNATPMLDRLCSAGAILFREGPRRYRYHELFRSFLEQRVRGGPEHSYEAIGSASAVVCGRVGRWSDAIELHTELHEAVPLARLLSERGFELIDRGETDLVYRALDTLGDAEFTTFPVALAVKASLESLHGSFDVAEAWFRDAIAHVDDFGQRGAIVFRFATDLVRQDRRDAIELLQPIVAEGGHDLELAVSLAGLLATAYATHQQGELAAQTIERALDQLIDVNDSAVRAKLYFQAGYVAFFARDPERAKAYARQAVETAFASHLYDIAARALSILYNIAMDYEDDVRAGRLYLDQLASCSIKAGSRNLLIYATLGQFEIEVLRGNLRESARLDEALQALEVNYSMFASEMLLPAQALRAAWTGDFHRAYRLLATTAEKQITPMRQSQRYAEIALYAAAAGLHAEATAAVQPALALASKAEPSAKAVAFAKAYIGLTLTLLGFHQRAARLLSRMSRSNSLTPRFRQLFSVIRTINDRWSRGRYSTDLREALAALDACDFGGIGLLIEALPLPETFAQQFAQLTDHERDVLIHLSEGLQSDEIALLSGRTVEMVDALIRSLCRKLGCTTPRYAVALAQSADMLRRSVNSAT